MKDMVDIPPVWLLGSAAVAWLLAALVPVVMLPLPNWLGWIIFFAGLAWGISAIRLFFRKNTPVDPRQRANVLLVEGAFRLNRNPIYTGMTVMLLGWAIVLGALSAFVLVVAFPMIITRRFIIDEEQGLRETFGGEAESYFARTRRW
jgi:protein-S-isoprenylcysteine O-methyltransferase Ste14